jgi:hypothetical protein
MDVIRKPAVSFEDMNALQVAGDADCRLFLASKAVQTHLDAKW